MNLAAFFQESARQTLLHEVIRHFPPSGSELRLLDVDACLTRFPEIGVIQSQRPDLVLIETSIVEIGQYADASLDAAIAFLPHDRFDTIQFFLEEIKRVLRPGGRFILLFPYIIPRNLEKAGFARILAERLLKGEIALNRGERPYTSEMTSLERVAVVAEGENQTGLLQGVQLFDVMGRFIHLLIRQTPNKPAWALKPDDKIAWEAAVVQNEGQETVALAFTAMPKAVAFMQTAVLAGAIQDINKIAKFNKAVAAEWPFAVWLNPTLEQVQAEYRLRGEFIAIDPTTAETPDE
ncbi:MAG: methyltransferase domain-containing protein [Chloroflexi bacterium]|nr:methyltransferase domain-containing protein [Chloroflexota bacterium]